MLIKSYRLPVLLQMSGYESKNWNLKNMFRFYVFPVFILKVLFCLFVNNNNTTLVSIKKGLNPCCLPSLENLECKANIIWRILFLMNTSFTCKSNGKIQV